MFPAVLEDLEDGAWRDAPLTHLKTILDVAPNLMPPLEKDASPTEKYKNKQSAQFNICSDFRPGNLGWIFGEDAEAAKKVDDFFTDGFRATVYYKNAQAFINAWWQPLFGVFVPAARELLKANRFTDASQTEEGRVALQTSIFHAVPTCQEVTDLGTKLCTRIQLLRKIDETMVQ